MITDTMRLAKLLQLASSENPNESRLAFQRASEMVNGDFVGFFATLAQESKKASPEAIQAAHQLGWEAAMRVRESQKSFDFMTVQELIDLSSTMTFKENQQKWVDNLGACYYKYGALSDKQIETLKNVVKNGKRKK